MKKINLPYIIDEHFIYKQINSKYVNLPPVSNEIE